MTTLGGTYPHSYCKGEPPGLAHHMVTSRILLGFLLMAAGTHLQRQCRIEFLV